ncbi:MAG: cell wall hydrolase [Eubacteriales bacterium]
MMHKQLLTTAFAAFLALAFVFGVITPTAQQIPETTQTEAQASPSESSGETEETLTPPPETEETEQTQTQAPPPETTEPPTQEEKISLPTVPAEAKSLSLYINGRAIEDGFCFELDGKIWLPVEGFGKLFGFEELGAEEGKCYITSRDRCIPCSVRDAELTVRNYGVLCAPIEPLLSAAGLKSTEIVGDEICIWGVPTFPEADDVYSYEDLYWLSRIIFAESGGEPFVGQLAVGTVVINRTRSSYYPNNIYDVIFDRLGGVQFTPVSSGTIYRTPSESSILAAKLCLEGFSLNDDILFFFNSSLASGSWITANRTYTMTVGHHDFYS